MEPTVRELLAEIADPSRPVEPMLTSPAWRSIKSRTKELSLDDSLAMIDAAGGPLQLDGGGTFDPHCHMILFAVGANPVPECSEALRAIADDVPLTAQAQVVRSLLEIGVRSSHPASIEAGLDLLDRYAEAGLELTARDTPLYWIVRQPSFPEVVEPRLRRLAAHEQLARAAEEVRTAYRVAGLLEDGGGEPSLFTIDYLRRLADRDPAELVFLTDEQVSARVGDEWSRVYEVVTSMPTILLTAWAAWQGLRKVAV